MVACTAVIRCGVASLALWTVLLLGLGLIAAQPNPSDAGRFVRARSYCGGKTVESLNTLSTTENLLGPGSGFTMTNFWPSEVTA